jgi:hypothetical protein
LSKFLVPFFKKEPLSLPLAFRECDLHNWAVTKTFDYPGCGSCASSERRFCFPLTQLPWLKHPS